MKESELEDVRHCIQDKGHYFGFSTGKPCQCGFWSELSQAELSYPTNRLWRNKFGYWFEQGEFCLEAQERKNKAMLQADPVNHPSHYIDGKIEVIEFIEDKKLCFHLGNAVKYISRAGKKDPAKFKEDLLKAKWYLERKLELLKEEPKRPNDMDKNYGPIGDDINAV